MMDREERSDNASALWHAFAGRHPGHPFLMVDPLYSMTEATVDAIKHEQPRFFSAEDEDFERDLARTVHHGFRHQFPIGEQQTFLGTGDCDHPLMPPRALSIPKEEIDKLVARPGLTIDEFLREIERLSKVPRTALKQLVPTFNRWPYEECQPNELIRNVNEFVAMCWEDLGRIGADIKAARDAEKEESRIIERRQEAYAGWLITHSTFRQELRYMQRRWDRDDGLRRGIPLLDDDLGPIDVNREKNLPKNLSNSFGRFYRRWCLRSLLTWDLPQPRSPILSPRQKIAPMPSNDEGLSLFIPWSLLRGGQLNMQEMFQRLRFETAPEHLRPWLALDTVRRSNQPGEIAYRQMFWIYRCSDLVLLTRYEAKCKRNVKALDTAFGELLQITEEQVRKLRQRLVRERKASDPDNSLPGS